jgi:hypothetical protein
VIAGVRGRFVLLAIAWSTIGYNQACRRAGLSAEAVGRLRAHLAKVDGSSRPNPSSESYSSMILAPG